MRDLRFWESFDMVAGGPGKGLGGVAVDWDKPCG